MSQISVLHILGGFSNAGAGRGAYWLHRALAARNIDSKILIQHSLIKNDPAVIPSYTDEKGKETIKSFLKKDEELLSPYPVRDPFIFSPSIYGPDITRYEAYKKATIIHLHWINYGFISIRQISKINKPIVWTFRDSWPITGGCHIPYRFGCEKFKLNCGCCPHLGSRDMFDLSWRVMRQKKKCFGQNIYPVAMSPWMYERIKESSLFRGEETEVIPNNVDTEVFAPFDKQKAREMLNLDPQKKIVLFGAINLDDSHKGLSLFLDAIKKYPDQNRITCVFFGRADHNSIETCETDKVNLGYVQDDERLRMIFAAADVFVAPLKNDNFSKTVAEAMACGLPVINIMNREGNEIMVHKENGFMAEKGTADEIIDGLNWIMALDMDKYREMSVNARKKILSLCSFDAVSKRYISLYVRILKESQSKKRRIFLPVKKD